MNNPIVAIAMAGMLLATSVQAQTTANTPPIGQAVSGQNSTAAGTSGTGLHTNGTATTRSPHGEVGRQAKAEQEVMKANARAVKEVPGDRVKEAKKKGKRRAEQAAAGS